MDETDFDPDFEAPDMGPSPYEECESYVNEGMPDDAWPPEPDEWERYANGEMPDEAWPPEGDWEHDADGEPLEDEPSDQSPPVDKSAHLAHRQLCIEARQALFQAELGQAGRLLDVLYYYGAQPGQEFNEQFIIEFCRLQHIKMAEKTIRKVLKAKIEERRIFVELGPDDDPHDIFFPPELNVKEPLNPRKREKKSRGRPVIWYVIPSPDSIAWQLGVRRDVSEIPFTVKRFATLHTYRVATYRHHLGRKPGDYSRADLGHTIDVSGSTTVQYDKEIHTEIVPNIKTDYIDIVSMQQFQLDENAPPGAWLEDQLGKCYRPTGENALRIIQAFGYVAYRRRLRNSYSIPGYRPNDVDSASKP